MCGRRTAFAVAAVAMMLSLGIVIPPATLEAAVPSGWSTPVDILGESTNNSGPELALDSSDKPHAVWSGYDGYTDRIFFTDMGDFGWNSPTYISVTSTNNAYPRIALDSAGRVHVAWTGNDGSVQRVYYSVRGLDDSWSVPIVVSTAPDQNCTDMVMALDSEGSPHLAWACGPYGTREVYHSADTGSGWSAPVHVSTTSTDNNRPAMSIDAGGNPHLVWTGDNGTTEMIYYASDAGGGWSAPVLLSTTTIGNFGAEIAVGPDGGFHVTWSGENTEWGFPRVFYSEKKGSGWSVPFRLSSPSGTYWGDYGARVAVDRTGTVCVAWVGDSIDGPYMLNFYFRENKGAGWSAPVTMGSAGQDQEGWLTGFSLDQEGSPHVLWEAYSEQDFLSNVFYQERVGGNWQQPLQLSESTYYGDGSTVVLDSAGNPHIGWTSTQEYDFSLFDEHIYYTAGGHRCPSWYLAEGTNAWGFNTYITLANAGDQELHAKLTYMDPSPATGNGGVFERVVTLPPESQTTVSSEPDIGAVDFSTRVECLEGSTIAVDRTMYWTGQDASYPEAHSTVAVTSPADDWFLPEGSSDWGFETWILVQNPNDEETTVELEYMIEGKGSSWFEKTVPARSRASFDMASDIGQEDASVRVRSGYLHPIIVERSMYRNGRREGSCSVGAVGMATDYYLAEGTTAWGFTTYLLIQNPCSCTQEVTVTFMKPTSTGQSETVVMQPIIMPESSRKTIRVNDVPGMEKTDFSTHVEVQGGFFGLGIVAERAMYWQSNVDPAEVCHASIGLAWPGQSFYLPDGQTSDGWETWTLVCNPNREATDVEVTYLPEGGGDPISFTSFINAESRSTFSMADEIPSGRASVTVRSLNLSVPILVERAMYRNGRALGTGTVGSTDDLHPTPP